MINMNSLILPQLIMKRTLKKTIFSPLHFSRTLELDLFLVPALVMRKMKKMKILAMIWKIGIILLCIQLLILVPSLEPL